MQRVPARGRITAGSLIGRAIWLFVSKLIASGLTWEFCRTGQK
jgi:hypothetical protein